ncbi:MAG TPA: NAD-dependent succinate-semialdehyde dehydrogenase [Saprospiraceae bacterium]|nr:NAD-dependent succinate-semialdehyde dehydrogenase [Saprospiraceae bacterium]HMP25103.1 NAD-dependent succinate-semialdehyde dehydrogenase [Saprospiraceae bacterium]
MFATINPATNTQLKTFPTLTPAEIQEKLRLCAETYEQFLRQTNATTRSAWIQEIGHQLRAKAHAYADLITLEMGKPLRQSLAEIEKCAWLCTYFAEHGAAFLQPKTMHTENRKSYVRYDAIGAVLGIMPWNFPFWQAFRFAIPALLGGNAILLKPAPNVPQSSLAMDALFRAAIGRVGVFQTLFAATEDVAQIIEHPIVRGVALTGSDRAGASVAALAGAAIKKCVLELGGSDAFIVLEDADLEAAAHIGVQARMNNNGQTCIAAKRFIVHAQIAERFIDLLKIELAQLKIGDPHDMATDLSVLARPDLRDQLAAQVAESVEKGATVLLEGGPLPGGGNHFRPVMLTDLQPGMPAYDQELFGPVIALFIVQNEAEAIKIANNSVYGLGAAIWSNDVERAEAIAAQLEAGAVFINDFVKSDPRLPFGGVKRSGFGRELAEEGIKEFVNIKTVVVK